MKKYLKKLGLVIGFGVLLSGIFVIEGKAEELKDENPERLDTIYGMDEEGNIFEVDGSAGILVVDEAENANVAGNEDLSEAENNSRAITPKVVNFNTKGSKTTEYKECDTNAAGYTCGAYGADGAYLREEDGCVVFMLSGVIGKVDADEVQVVNFKNAKGISYYMVEDGKLKHRIAHKITEQSYSSLVNGIAPSYLKEGVKYYSYDGHYFYEDYSTMIIDYQNEVRDNSVNPEEPYYNYYQFLSMRSRIEYTADELYSIINTKLKAMGSLDKSKMKNKGRLFVQYQNTYGVNALLMTSIGCNESAYGTSSICQNKNNLFGLNAVDESPTQSSYQFTSIQSCIKDFADNWMSKGYLSPDDWRCKGAFVGNKASGINVSYASDPYWGEKAANIAYTLDQVGGNKDQGIYTIGIKDTVPTKHTDLKVRKGSSTSTEIIYQTGKWSNYAFLIQKSTPENNFYKIQSEAVLNSDRTAEDTSTGKYKFAKMYAYVSANYVKIVHQGKDIKLQSLATPKNVSATYSDGKVTFKWEKVENAEGYYVYRKADNGSYSRVKAITSGDTLKYTDSNIMADTTYTYSVRAYNKSIWSSYNTTGVSVTTPADNITYTDYKTTTDVNYRSGAGTNYAKQGVLTKGTVISVENGYSKTANGFKWVRFKLNGKKYYVASEYLEKVVLLSKPSLVSVKYNDGVVTFKWKKVADAKGYYVYRKVKDGSYKKIGTVKSGTKVTYKDSNVSKGKTYIYTVKAYNDSDVSGYKTAGISISIPKTYTKYKTTTSVNYRSGAGTSYAKKGTLAKGKVISVEDGYSKTADGYTWVRFKLNGKNYYIVKKYLKKV